MLQWLQYLNGSQRTKVADDLLDGAGSSIRESAACIALGLVRPALFSMRTHIDLLLAWLYFKDHPVEWRTLNETGEGYRLKREILDYLKDNFVGFRNRFSILTEVAERSTIDPYRLLSAHIHAQSAIVMPFANNLSDVVRGEKLSSECALLWRDVVEFVSDILTSVYALKWAAMPDAVKKSVEARLKSKKGNYHERFFDGL